jgi:fibronectin-binding autotransporter adhesin
VVAGAYGYRLYKNGVTDPTDGDWYLRSSLLDPAAPQESQSNAPLYQPGVPLYESYAGILQSFNGLETLRQRVGNRSWEGGGDGNGVWAKMQAGYQRFAPKSSTSGSDYDVDHWQVQGGADAQVAESDKGRLVAGLSGRYGELSGDVASTYGSGKVATTGYGVGATLTWYGADGVYVDGQADATWYDSDLLSSATVGRLTKGNDAFGYAASVEAGKRVALDGNWSLVPQGQLIYSSVDFDHFSDPFGAAVSLDRSRSVKSRLGLSADFSNQWTEGSGQVSRIDTYGIANLYYDFGGSTRVDVSDTRLESENEALWGGLGYGFSYNWAGDRYSLYVEVSANTSLADFADSYSVKANGGLRLKW